MFLANTYIVCKNLRKIFLLIFWQPSLFTHYYALGKTLLLFGKALSSWFFFQIHYNAFWIKTHTELLKLLKFDINSINLGYYKLKFSSGGRNCGTHDHPPPPHLIRTCVRECENKHQFLDEDCETWYFYPFFVETRQPICWSNGDK